MTISVVRGGTKYTQDQKTHVYRREISLLRGKIFLRISTTKQAIFSQAVQCIIEEVTDLSESYQVYVAK